MREPQGQHLSGTDTHHKRRIWPKILLITFVLLLIIAGIGAYIAKTMYDQANEIKAHEQNAIAMLSGFSDKNDINSLDKVSQKLPQVQNETQQANDIAHGKLWNMAANAPYIGDDVKTVQGMTSMLDSVVHDSVPQFLDVVNQLKTANLNEGNGQINLQPILQAQIGIKTANTGLQTQIRNFDQLPAQDAKLSVVRDTHKTAGEKLSVLAKKVDALAKTFQILPDFLGAGQAHNYAVMSMTTSEARSAGGLIGSVGLMTTDNGKISIGEFKPNTAYIPYGRARATSSETAMFNSWGPLQMSFDIRDMAVFPDTSRSAEAMQSIWNRTPWGKQQPIDGVITMDPVFLQALIKLNGDVKLSNGQVLTGDNTAEFLLNTIYKSYSPAEQDIVFGEVASQSVNSMFSGLDINKMAQLGEILGNMAKGRHFSIYSFDPVLEKNYMDSGYTAQSPSSEEKPQVGVYVTEQNASKMDWYIKRTSKITKTSTNSTGARTYHVDYTMTNTITSQELNSVSRYISGVNSDMVPSGSGTEKTLIYAPAGGSISNVTVSGQSGIPKKMNLDGKNVYAAIATVMPGASVTFSFDVTTSDKTVSDLDIDQTPMGWEDLGVTRVNY